MSRIEGRRMGGGAVRGGRGSWSAVEAKGKSECCPWYLDEEGQG